MVKATQQNTVAVLVSDKKKNNKNNIIKSRANLNQLIYDCSLKQRAQRWESDWDFSVMKIFRQSARELLKNGIYVTLVQNYNKAVDAYNIYINNPTKENENIYINCLKNLTAPGVEKYQRVNILKSKFSKDQFAVYFGDKFYEYIRDAVNEKIKQKQERANRVSKKKNAPLTTQKTTSTTPVVTTTKTNKQVITEEEIDNIIIQIINDKRINKKYNKTEDLIDILLDKADFEKTRETRAALKKVFDSNKNLFDYYNDYETYCSVISVIKNTNNKYNISVDSVEAKKKALEEKICKIIYNNNKVFTSMYTIDNNIINAIFRNDTDILPNQSQIVVYTISNDKLDFVINNNQHNMVLDDLLSALNKQKDIIDNCGDFTNKENVSLLIDSFLKFLKYVDQNEKRSFYSNLQYYYTTNTVMNANNVFNNIFKPARSNAEILITALCLYRNSAKDFDDFIRLYDEQKLCYKPTASNAVFTYFEKYGWVKLYNNDKSSGGLFWYILKFISKDNYHKIDLSHINTINNCLRELKTLNSKYKNTYKNYKSNYRSLDRLFNSISNLDKYEAKDIIKFYQNFNDNEYKVKIMRIQELSETVTNIIKKIIISNKNNIVINKDESSFESDYIADVLYNIFKKYNNNIDEIENIIKEFTGKKPNLRDMLKNDKPKSLNDFIIILNTFMTLMKGNLNRVQSTINAVINQCNTYSEYLDEITGLDETTGIKNIEEINTVFGDDIEIFYNNNKQIDSLVERFENFAEEFVQYFEDIDLSNADGNVLLKQLPERVVLKLFNRREKYYYKDNKDNIDEIHSILSYLSKHNFINYNINNEYLSVLNNDFSKECTNAVFCNMVDHLCDYFNDYNIEFIPVTDNNTDYSDNTDILVNANKQLKELPKYIDIVLKYVNDYAKYNNNDDGASLSDDAKKQNEHLLSLINRNIKELTSITNDLLSNINEYITKDMVTYFAIYGLDVNVQIEKIKKQLKNVLFLVNRRYTQYKRVINHIEHVKEDIEYLNMIVDINLDADNIDIQKLINLRNRIKNFRITKNKNKYSNDKEVLTHILEYNNNIIKTLITLKALLFNNNNKAINKMNKIYELNENTQFSVIYAKIRRSKIPHKYERDFKNKGSNKSFALKPVGYYDNPKGMNAASGPNAGIYNQSIDNMINFFENEKNNINELISYIDTFTNTIIETRAKINKILDKFYEIQREKRLRNRIKTSGLKYKSRSYTTGYNIRKDMNKEYIDKALNAHRNEIRNQIEEYIKIRNTIGNYLKLLSLSLSSNIDLYTFAKKAAEAFIESIMHYDNTHSIHTYIRESQIIRKYNYNTQPGDAMLLSGELITNTKLVCYKIKNKNYVDICVSDTTHDPLYKSSGEKISNAELWHLLEYAGFDISSVFYKKMNDDDLISNIAINNTTYDNFNNIILNNNNNENKVEVIFFAGIGTDKIIYSIVGNDTNNTSTNAPDNIFAQILHTLKNNRSFMSIMRHGIYEKETTKEQKLVGVYTTESITGDRINNYIALKKQPIVNIYEQIRTITEEINRYTHVKIKDKNDLIKLYNLINTLINLYDTSYTESVIGVKQGRYKYDDDDDEDIEMSEINQNNNNNIIVTNIDSKYRDTFFKSIGHAFTNKVGLQIQNITDGNELPIDYISDTEIKMIIDELKEVKTVLKQFYIGQ